LPKLGSRQDANLWLSDNPGTVRDGSRRSPWRFSIRRGRRVRRIDQRYISDLDPILSNNPRMLLRDREPRLAELVHQCVFIDFLKEFNSQRVAYRQGAANDSFGKELTATSTVHLRVLRDLWLSNSLTDRTAKAADLNRSRPRNKPRQVRGRCQIPAGKSVRPRPELPGATPAHQVRARTPGMTYSRIQRQHSGVSRGSIRTHRPSPRPVADYSRRARRLQIQ
jgi:hypothetical protein